MFKKIFKESIKYIATHHKIVRISFITGFVHTVYIFIGLIWKINNVIHNKYGTTEENRTYLNIVIDWFREHGLGSLLFGVGLFFFFGYVILYPLGRGIMVYYVANQKVLLGKSLNSYFRIVVLESLLAFITLSGYHLSALTWVYIMDIHTSILIQIVLGIIMIVIVISTILFPFSDYFLLLGPQTSSRPEKQATDALSASASLVSSNIGTTIKFSLLHVFLKLRFFINLFLVVGVPGGLAYLLITTNVLEVQTATNIAIGIGSVLLIFIVYVDSLLDAFFVVFWYKLYTFLQGKELEETENDTTLPQ